MNEWSRDLCYAGLYEVLPAALPRRKLKLQASEPAPISFGNLGHNFNSVRDFFGVYVYSHSLQFYNPVSANGIDRKDLGVSPEAKQYQKPIPRYRTIGK